MEEPTTLDVGTSSLYHVKKVIAALGATITESEPTPGACGYTRITISKEA